MLLLVIIAVYGLQVGIEGTAERFEQTQDLTNRLELTARGTAMLEDYPLSGVWLGNFQRVFPRYEPETISGRRHYRFAHNDWVQVGIELGLPGLLLVLAGYCLVLIRFLRLWLQSRDPVAVNLGAGLLVGVMALGLHSFFDFNLHIPANVLALGGCLALLQAVLQRQRGEEDRGQDFTVNNYSFI